MDANICKVNTGCLPTSFHSEFYSTRCSQARVGLGKTRADSFKKALRFNWWPIGPGNIPFSSKNEAALCLAIMGGHRPPFEELLEIGEIGDGSFCFRRSWW